MGRLKKIGLDYFPFDVDFYQDIKVRKLIKYQGGKAIAVYTLLLCTIYKQGYYMRWDEELPFIVSESTGFEEAYIREVIKCCLIVGLFSKEMYDKEGILTSEGIQERYKKIIETCKRKCEISEYILISSEEKPISSEQISISSEEKPIYSEESTQSKGKERKEKEIVKKKVSPQSETPARPKKESLKINYQGLVDLFNQTFEGKIPIVRGPLSEKRKQAIKARIAEHDKETVMEVFQKVLNSSFLLGRTGGTDRKWKCNFDFIFSPSGFQKILEGNYDDEKSVMQVRNDRREDERQQMHQEQVRRNNDRATYAINPFQLVKLRELKEAGNETAVKILSGEIHMTNIEITNFIKSVT